MHRLPVVVGYVRQKLDGGRGPLRCMGTNQFYESDSARDFVRGYTLKFGRGLGSVTEAITSMENFRPPWGAIAITLSAVW